MGGNRIKCWVYIFYGWLDMMDSESIIGYNDINVKPLFGESTRRDRFLNLVVGGFTSLLVTITLICGFVHPRPPQVKNIYFAIVITLICISHLILIYWYRQGDLEPKFRKLIYFNAINIILLCICANIYIFA